MEALARDLRAALHQAGAVLVGIADLRGLVSGPLETGVAVAVPLPVDVLREIRGGPTRAYLEAYRQLNERLDAIVTAGAALLIARGHAAQARTTDVVQWRDDPEWRTPLPHKTVATRAGLGWIGKSCLLVTPKYGSGVRLSSLLTDAALPCDEPVVRSQCGQCELCVQACPARSLKNTIWTAGMSREELFDRKACRKKQFELMRERTGIDRDLCGKCFAVCPHTVLRVRKELAARALGRE